MGCIPANRGRKAGKALRFYWKYEQIEEQANASKAGLEHSERQNRWLTLLRGRDVLTYFYLICHKINLNTVYVFQNYLLLFRCLTGHFPHRNAANSQMPRPSGNEVLASSPGNRTHPPRRVSWNHDIHLMEAILRRGAKNRITPKWKRFSGRIGIILVKKFTNQRILVVSQHLPN